MRVPLLNFEGGPGILLLNFEGGPGVPLSNFEGGPGSRVTGSQDSGSRGPGPTFTPCLCRSFPLRTILLLELNYYLKIKSNISKIKSHNNIGLHKTKKLLHQAM